MSDIPLIQLDSVYKFHYTDALETTAVNNLSLTINKGEFVAVMGPSGSGKSTLLNLLGMIDELSRGTYTFAGQDIGALSRKQRAVVRKENLAFIFQSFNLIDELTALENVMLPLLYLKVPTAERRERAAAALANLDMLHRKDHYPSQLSGGQQQRVAIARATVTRPALLLADEPTGNLDSENGAVVMEKLKAFHAAGATIIMVTHSPTDAAHAGRTLHLFDGSLLQSERAYLTNNA